MKYIETNFSNFLNESINGEFILYRGVGFDEAINSIKAGHLIYLSNDPMSNDWEVIEHSLGDSINDMSEDDISNYINDLVYWRPVSKGVNLTSDLENASGYSDIVFEVNVIGDYAHFSHSYYFAKDPKDCIIKYVHYNGKRYIPKDFLILMENGK